MEKPAIFIVEDESIVANDIKETLLESRVRCNGNCEIR